jgi:hypothetical protein
MTLTQDAASRVPQPTCPRDPRAAGAAADVERKDGASLSTMTKESHYLARSGRACRVRINSAITRRCSTETASFCPEHFPCAAAARYVVCRRMASGRGNIAARPWPTTRRRTGASGGADAAGDCQSRSQRCGDERDVWAAPASWGTGLRARDAAAHRRGDGQGRESHWADERIQRLDYELAHELTTRSSARDQNQNSTGNETRLNRVSVWADERAKRQDLGSVSDGIGT